MAITRVDGPTESADAERPNNTGSESITIAADAELLVVGVIGYRNQLTFFTGGGITIDGKALTAVIGGDDIADTSCVLWYYSGTGVDALPVGEKTLAWDWAGTGTVTYGAIIVWATYKGVDLTGPVRDTYGDQLDAGAGGHHDADLASSSGDYLVALFGNYSTAAETYTWSSTGTSSGGKVADFDAAAAYRSMAGSWADYTASGNAVLTCDMAAGRYTAMSAIAMIPAAAGGRTTKNTRALPLGIHHGEAFRMENYL